MKIITCKNILRCILCIYSLNFFAQDIRINQSGLPFAIPIIEYASQGEKVVYQWLENDEVIAGAEDGVYIIPSKKDIGIYSYIHQVRCSESPNWMSSNTFTVEIYRDEPEDLDPFPDPFQVVFSPQQQLTGYLEALVAKIDQARQQLDISIYSMDNYDIFLSLQRAVSRGVQIRMLYEGASKDRNQEANTYSHKLEAVGIDVKYVNKTNHNKFVIADREFLVTSSGNWNVRANWKYEDSSLFISNKAVVAKYSAEFELLWNNSREFGKTYEYKAVNPDSLLVGIPDTLEADALFTSSNYRITHSAKHGPTFSKEGNKQKLADTLVYLIDNAEKSIKIAANYLRSRSICQALIAKKQRFPEIEIKVITDQNEYITENYNRYLIEQREQCLTNANTPAKQRDCLEKNFMYSYELMLSDIDIRFKVYSYKWHRNTAHVMHHKYAVFDENVVAVGSYNYSYNSETACMENLLIFNRKAAAMTVEQYVKNFDQIWNLGRAENFYSELLLYLNGASRYVPLLYRPVALTQSEYTVLKERVERAVPAVTHTYFKKFGQLYRSYIKGLRLSYTEGNQNISRMHEYFDQKFTIDYLFNKQGNLWSSRFQSDDSISLSTDFYYDEVHDRIAIQSPLLKVDFTYNNHILNTVQTAQGTHSWGYIPLNNRSTKILYHAPYKSNYIETTWDSLEFPKTLKDSKNRMIHWRFDEYGQLSQLRSAVHIRDFKTSNTTMLAQTNAANYWQLELQSLNKFTITTTGEVSATVNYATQPLGANKQEIMIHINNETVDSGKGRMAHLKYVQDAYGRLVQSGDLFISRKPYSGDITEITHGKIREYRTYNRWDLLTKQQVKYRDEIVYKAEYEYDGLHRIQTLTEQIKDVVNRWSYLYHDNGELAQVFKNDLLWENYLYDDFGNRSYRSRAGAVASYLNNERNQTVGWTGSRGHWEWQLKYNKAGQLEEVIKDSLGLQLVSRVYQYDVFDNLNMFTTNGQQTRHVYDAFNRRVATYQGMDLEQKIIYGLNELPLAVLNRENRLVATYIYVDGGIPILMRNGSIEHYIVTDIRGSLRLVLDTEDGTMAQQMDYDAFGSVAFDSNPGYTPFGYAAGLYDYRSGIVRFGQREYDAEMGKWTTESPLGFLSGSFNNYNYALNDPINKRDFQGMFSTYLGADVPKRASQLQGVYLKTIGPSGKGITWNDLNKLYPHGQLHYNSTLIRNLDYRIYTPFGNRFLHVKLNALDQSRVYWYKPESILEWTRF